MVTDIEELHRVACSQKKSFYVDPRTNLCVFTAHHLSTRKCCGCGCRHCPYKPSTHRPPPASFLHEAIDDIPDEIDILFYSGGKDSFLALRRLQAENVRPVVLLTTYDDPSSLVAHQEVLISAVVAQAKQLKLPLLGVPVGGISYIDAIRNALRRLYDHGVEIKRIAFGDLHLMHVREWRESELTILGPKLHYPLWRIPYDKLLEDLERSGAVARISAVNGAAVEAAISVGDIFDRHMIERLPPGIDRFGENGEFHTLIHVTV